MISTGVSGWNTEGVRTEEVVAGLSPRRSANGTKSARRALEVSLATQ